MFDGVTRLVLLIALLAVTIRGLWLLRTTRRLGRRWALFSMMPAQILLMWFYTHNLLTRPFIRDVPDHINIVLRAGIYMVIVGWFVKQEVIRITEHAEQTLTGD